jgi:hypothetical protein
MKFGMRKKLTEKNDSMEIAHQANLLLVFGGIKALP